MTQTKVERNRKVRERYAAKKLEAQQASERKAKHAASERVRYAKNKVKIKHQRAANKYGKRFSVTSGGYTSVVYRVKIKTKKATKKPKPVKVKAVKPKPIKPTVKNIPERRIISRLRVNFVRMKDKDETDYQVAQFNMSVPGNRTAESIINKYNVTIPDLEDKYLEGEIEYLQYYRTDGNKFEMIDHQKFKKKFGKKYSDQSIIENFSR